MRDRLAHEPVVARHVERHERLDARVAHVLELLVVRRVEVGLERAEARHAPVHLPHVREPRQVAREACLLLEREGREDPVKVVDDQRLVPGLDIELHVAVRPEPEALEAAVHAASGTDHVLHADRRLALDLVAIPLVPLRVLQALGVGEVHAAPRTSARLQNGVGIRQVRLVEQGLCLGVRGNHQVAGAPQEGVAGSHPLRPPYHGEADVRLLHRRDGARHELPAAAFSRGRAAAGLRPWGTPALSRRRLWPARVREVELLPAPRVDAPRPRTRRAARRSSRPSPGRGPGPARTPGCAALSTPVRCSRRIRARCCPAAGSPCGG